MTCIVGIVDKKKGTVVIGADKQATGGLRKVNRQDSKIFRNGDFVIGCTTSYRMIQLLQFSFTPPHMKDTELFKYMCTDFISEVRKCFTDNGYMQKWTEGDDRGGTFLVGYKDRLFKINNDFQVGESADGYDSCGCGIEFALGSLYETEKTKLSTKHRVMHALKASEYFSAGVGAPFETLETKK